MFPYYYLWLTVYLHISKPSITWCKTELLTLKIESSLYFTKSTILPNKSLHLFITFKFHDLT